MDTFAQNVYQHRVVYIVKKSADIALYEPLYTCKSTLYLLQSCVTAAVWAESV